MLVATNDCSNKSMFVATKAYYVCHEKSILCLLCCDKIMFVATNICYDRGFVAAKMICSDKHNFFATERLSQQAYFLSLCRDKHVFKLYLGQLPPMIVYYRSVRKLHTYWT